MHVCNFYDASIDEHVQYAMKYISVLFGATNIITIVITGNPTSAFNAYVYSYALLIC